MDGFSDSKNNATIRGYILRSLVKGRYFSNLVKALAHNMISCGLIHNPDISKHLYYLEQCNLIEFTDSNVDAFTAIEKDAVVRLTVEGIRFIENGGDSEMGIDL